MASDGEWSRRRGDWLGRRGEGDSFSLARSGDGGRRGGDRHRWLETGAEVSGPPGPLRGQGGWGRQLGRNETGQECRRDWEGHTWEKLIP